MAAAKEASQTDRFYVYLLRGFDSSVVERAMRKRSPRNWWSLGDAEAIQVGQVSVSVSEANLGRARAAFTVPELPPATYHLMLCDATCAEPLADVVPAKGFTVVVDPATSQMAERVERLERRIGNQGRQLAVARIDADRTRYAARHARSAVEQLEGTTSAVADEVQSEPLLTRGAYVGWLLAGALAAALALLVLRHRRSRPPETARDSGWHPSDEELRELLSFEPGHRPR